MAPAEKPGLGALTEAAGALKSVRRKGWVDRGVPDAESVADHSYRLALLAWAVARARGLDGDLALKIALVHDLAEAEIGDETPFDHLLASDPGFDLARFDQPAPDDPARRAAKHARERAVIERLANALPEPIGSELLGYWRAYDQQSAPEARLVKALDRVETLLQAEDYRAAQPDLPIGSFRAQVDQSLLQVSRSRSHVSGREGAGVTRGPEPETGNQEPETGDQEPETGDQEPASGDQEPETGDQEPASGSRTPTPDARDR